MEYVILDVPAESADDLAEKILSVMAEKPAAGLPGFATTVDSSLLPGLLSLGTAASGRETNLNLSLVRLYEAPDPGGVRFLMAGERLFPVLPGFAEVLRKAGLDMANRGIAGAQPMDDEWFIIGMALPGWILLFDQESEELEKYEIEGNINVMVLPSPEGCPVESLSPTLTTSAGLECLVLHLLTLMYGGLSLTLKPSGG